MYTPSHFKIDDLGTLQAFMQRHNFATLVTHDGQIPHATHLPFLLNPTHNSHGSLLTHMARANPQWSHFTKSEVLVIFTGPHAYISPAWYTTQPAVPTWNYTAVHAYGTPRIITQHDRFAQMLHDLVEFHESGRPNRWHGQLPPEFRDGLIKGIVGIEIEITRLEGKFKLSQNRPQDAPSVIAMLEDSMDQTDRDTAKMMKERL
ncbi:FMN-binding negative transcriptional regulator [Prosthecobacter sp.]|uniref:FMN-binding negative transcriptional regulator n=1 Tax=Prosthecobacter sp. TaxID=1965333 RepID=UPI003784827C